MNDLDSREKILQAAMMVFAEKGKFGAKMEEIAAKAEINKAMLYYYYNTKENLYREMLQYNVGRKISEVFHRIAPQMRMATDPLETLKFIVAAYFEMFSTDRTYTKIMLDAIASSPEEIESAFAKMKVQLNLNIPDVFIGFLEDAMQRGIFRRVDPKQLILNIIAMTMIYFFGAPAIKAMLDLQIEDEQQFLQARQAAIVDLVLFGLVTHKPA
jgi:TetR/AcrR family transcriptional regulator